MDRFTRNCLLIAAFLLVVFLTNHLTWAWNQCSSPWPIGGHTKDCLIHTLLTFEDL